MKESCDSYPLSEVILCGYDIIEFRKDMLYSIHMQMCADRMRSIIDTLSEKGLKLKDFPVAHALGGVLQLYQLDIQSNFERMKTLFPLVSKWVKETSNHDKQMCLADAAITILMNRNFGPAYPVKSIDRDNVANYSGEIKNMILMLEPECIA